MFYMKVYISTQKNIDLISVMFMIGIVIMGAASEGQENIILNFLVMMRVVKSIHRITFSFYNIIVYHRRQVKSIWRYTV